MKKRPWRAAWALLLVLACMAAQGCADGTAGRETFLLETPADVASEEVLSDDLRPGDGSGSDAGAAAVIVYVCGAVARPGLYPASAEDRVGDLIERAGGFLEDADPERLNLARRVRDEERIRVPFAGEDTGDRTEEEASEADPDTEAHGTGTGSFGTGDAAGMDGRTDVNRADRDQLMALPGIGEARADAILAYRRQHGPCQDVQQLLDVPGIGSSVLRQFSDLVFAGP